MSKTKEKPSTASSKKDDGVENLIKLFQNSIKLCDCSWCKTPRRFFEEVFPLDEYLPEYAVKMAYEYEFSTEALQPLGEDFSLYLESNELKKENLANVHKNLLQIEDVYQLASYAETMQQGIALKSLPGWSTVFKIDEAVAKVISDTFKPFMDEILLVKWNPESEQLTDFAIDELYPKDIVATIADIKKHFIFVGTLNPQKLIDENALYSIIVRPLRAPFRYQYRALGLLNELVLDYIFPTVKPSKPFSYINICPIKTGLNAEQLQAVRNIVSGPNPHAPYIIFGPPGTGKTTTVVEAILQLRLRKPHSRILVTASTNSACNTICLQLLKSLEANQFLKIKNDFIRVFANLELKKIPSNLLKYSNFFRPHHKTYAHCYPAPDTLAQYGILVATLCTVGKYLTGKRGAEWGFSHVFIDEAGATTEPETLVAIADIKQTKTHVILSGDVKQLGPVIRARRATELGLKKTLMGRLLERDCYAIDDEGKYDETLQTRLVHNYRSQSEIVRLYSTLYYDGKLIASAPKKRILDFSGWSILSNPKFPIIFNAVYGVVNKTTESTSSSNELEVEVLQWYIRQLIGTDCEGHKVTSKDIGIVSPYKLQCEVIRKKLGASINDLEVGTVELFQGREKPIIIASMVQSFRGLGFAADAQRLNVILSRATSLLILIGNMETLSQNDDMRYIIDLCSKNGTLRRKARPQVKSEGTQ